MNLQEALSALDNKPQLTAEDALALRRIIFAEGLVLSQDEAEALFKLNADAGSIAPEWRDLFVEAMTEFVVRQQRPPGYVDEAKADWLIACVAGYRRVREDEVEMLIHVLDEADQTPAKLSNFVLSMIKAACMREIERQGRIEPKTIERLRRALFAGGGEGNIAITRHEAEVLFDINDALKAAAPDPVWADLFVRAVADAVLFETPWRPDADTEFKDEAWLADTSIHPFRHMLASRPAASAAISEGFREIFHWDFANHDLEKAEAADEAMEERAEQVTADEAHWLLQRIGRTGGIDANEMALIAFIRANARTIDASLKDLVAELDARPATGASAAPVSVEPPVFGRRRVASAAS